MGKKYEAYEKAAQAETASRVRYEAELIGGDREAAKQAATDYRQNVTIAEVTYDEWSKDIKG